MITTTEKLTAKVAAMPREDLERFARNVVWSLYSDTYCSEEGLCTLEEAKALGLKEGDVILNSEKEWSSDETGEVATDIDSAGLNPADLT